MYRYYRAKFEPTALWEDLSPVEWLSRKMLHNIYMQTGTWLVSRELAEAAGAWDTELLSDDDGEYFCRVLLASDAVRFVPEAKMYYRTPWFTTLGYIGQSSKKLDAHWRSMQMHVESLRSMGKAASVRASCLAYLQTNLVNFYSIRPDIVREMEQLATELGGKLTAPQLPLKYAWIKTMFGWGPAICVQQRARTIRWALERQTDKFLHRFEST
jgi:hypothetical protein